jgi:hypothetical protein
MTENERFFSRYLSEEIIDWLSYEYIGGEKKKRNPKGTTPNSPSSIRQMPYTNNTMITYLFENVNAYVEFCKNPNMDQIRPEKCPSCGEDHLHVHGQYIRIVQGEDQSLEITVFRFRCANPECKKTISMIPSFVGKYQRFTWDVQEKVCVGVEEGKSQEEAANQMAPPAGPVSSKTIWRWCKKCRKWIGEIGDKFWDFVLSTEPTIPLPRGVDRPASTLKYFQQIWGSLTNRVNVGVLHGLYLLRQLHPI